jgi:hypothetical protein
MYNLAVKGNIQSSNSAKDKKYGASSWKSSTDNFLIRVKKENL